MFPIGDDNTEIRIIPYTNYVIIGLNVLVFVLLQGFGSNEAFTYAMSLVPKEITTGTDIQGLIDIKDSAGRVAGQIPLGATPISVYITFLTSMFMHGSFGHIFGNMLFLFIFGDNIENRLGHIRYAVYYLLVGFAAAIGQVAMDPNSIIPMLGASGAISGVLGGYMLLFPTKKVRVIMFNFFATLVPSYVALGLWIVYQIVLGVMNSSATGGVAYAAHIGGFIAGLALIKIFAIGTNGAVDGRQ
jgi:membrane associated rhomboid family serine protease